MQIDLLRLASFVKDVVATRRIPDSIGSVSHPPQVIMKMDIEGESSTAKWLMFLPLWPWLSKTQQNCYENVDESRSPVKKCFLHAPSMEIREIGV